MKDICIHTWQHLKRSPGLSFSVVGVIALMVFFINIFLFLQFSTGKVVDSVVKKLPIVLFLEEWITDKTPEISVLISEIQTQYPSSKITYISPEDAFAEQEKRFPEISKVFTDDPDTFLSSSIAIELFDLGAYDSVHDILNKYSNFYIQYSSSHLDGYQQQYSKVQKIISFLSHGKTVIGWIILLFFMTVFVVLYLTIGNYVFVYRDQIHITQLVGGDSKFLYGPYVLQSSIYALVGTLIGAALFFGIFTQLQEFFFSFEILFYTFQTTFLAEFFEWMQMPIILQIIGMIIAGIVSGVVAVRRFIIYA